MVFRVLLVDDHPLFRKGLRLLLEEEVDFEVVGEAGDGHEAVELCRNLNPDVVVMDISMKGLNGIEATRRVISETSSTKVVALSIHSGERFVQGMLHAGASGYILKESAPEDLVEGIRTVIRGEVFLSSAVAGVVVAGLRASLERTHPGARSGRLTARNKEILRLVLAGESDARIASALGLDEDSVVSARRRLLAEHGVHNETELMEADREFGLSTDTPGTRSPERPVGALPTPAIPIRRTKLQRPPIPTDHIRRDELAGGLEQGIGLPLTLISAAAGYGKSLLCSSWIEGCGLRSAWLSLDQDDDDLRRFLQLVVAAVSDLFPDALDPTRSLLGTAVLSPVSVLADTLADDIDGIEERFVLVLDDLHHIRSASIHDLLTELLRHPPRPLHLVLITRRDPPLPLTRLRAAGRIREVRARDLRFNHRETAVLVDRIAGFVPSAEGMTRLEQRMEGWVVGLRLVALALRDADDQEALLEGMSGGIQHIQDYLLDEVLVAQSPQIRDWMLKASILDRFCGALCTAVCRSDAATDGPAPDGAEFLGSLQQSNLFIIPLDVEGTWFRYHHVFRDLLFDQLRRQMGPNEIADLHIRAADWFEGEGLTDEAVHHYLSGDCPDKSAEVVEKSLRPVMAKGPWYLVERWLSRLPEEEIISRPGLLLGRAYAHSFGEEFAKLPPILDRIDDLIDRNTANGEMSRQVTIFRGVSEFHAGHGESALEHLERAVGYIPSVEKHLDAMAVTHFLSAGQMAGHGARMRVAATRWLKETPLDHLREAYLTLGLRHLNYIDAELEAVDRNLVADRKFADAHNLNLYVGWCDYYSGLSRLHQGEFDAAVRFLEAMLDSKYLNWRRATVDAMTCLTIAYQAQGLAEQAADSLRALRDLVDHFGGPFPIVADSCATRLQIMQGRLEPTGWWTSAGTFDLDQAMFSWFENPSITRCRALIAEGAAAGLSEVQELLRVYVERSEAQHNAFHLIGLQCLQSVAFDRQGRDAKALTALEQAVELARTGGCVFQFVELGRPMFVLLNRLPKVGRHATFIDRILAVFESTAGEKQAVDTPRRRKVDVLVEPLTDRETEILELLEQRLIDKEIAAKLHISSSTVNSHCKNIYQKLEVSSRREAVARGIDLRILDDVRR